MTPQLDRLAGWPNFRRIASTPPVFVTEDHRAVQQVAWAADRDGVFGGAAPLLIRLDAHPDMGEPPRPWAEESARMADLDAVAAIVNSQRPDDGGWVMSAMQHRLAGDVATFFVHDYHRFPLDSQPFSDHAGASHRLWTFASIGEHLAGSHPGRSQAMERGIAQAPALWVDIDLDFATRRIDDETGNFREWSDEDWDREFDAGAIGWLAPLLRRASLVTIATEPEFCGGLPAVGRIAERLSRRFAPSGDWFAKL